MLYFIGYALILLGLFVILSAIVGLFRFPDFYSKIHAASLVDSLGMPSSLIGLALLQDSYLGMVKLFIGAILILILGPVITHALAKAALASGVCTISSQKCTRS